MASSDERDIEKYKKERRKAENKNNFKEAIEYSNEIGDLYAKQGEYEDAIAEHERALELSAMLADRKEEGFAHRKIGECHLETGNYKDAVRHLNEYLRLAKAVGSQEEQQRAYTTLGRTYLNRAESARDDVHEHDTFQESVSSADRALRLSLEFCEQLRGTISSREHTEMKVRSLLNLGLVSDIRGDDCKRCTHYMDRALKLAQENGLHDILFHINYSLAGVYSRAQNHPEALRYFDGAAASAEKMRDKDNLIEALIQKALILAQDGNYAEAKRSLKKAYKKEKKKSEKKEQLRNIFKAVLRLNLHHDKLGHLASTDHSAKMTVYEKLGDIASGVGLFRLALGFYLKQLRCAESLQKSPSEMILIYISLAETYRDDKQFAKAAKYYQKELICQEGNSEQQFHSQLNIASAQECAGEVYDVVKESYISALEYAKETSHRKLELHGLNLLSGCQANFKKFTEQQETISRISDLREKHNLEDGSELSETEDSQQKEEDEDAEEDEDEVDLDELDFDSEIEEEEKDSSAVVPGKARRTREARSLDFRTNEKGETPLQVACIQGNMKKVQMLLKQGCSVKVRDHAGWTPLHEVCNYGYLDIAQVLIDHGANVNDRGGQHCEGRTPLHDAATNGHLEVIYFLIQKAAANVHAKDDKGRTPLDSLIEYIHQTPDLRGEDLAELKAAERLLRSTMGGNNPHMNQKAVNRRDARRGYDSDEQENSLPSLPTPRTRKTTHHRHVIDESSQDSDSLSENESHDTSRVRRANSGGTKKSNASDVDSDDSPDDDFYRTDLNLIELDDPGAGASTYKQTIASLRSSAQSAKPSQKLRKRSSDPGPAMLDEDEIIDDWLVEDVVIPSTKRKRPDVDQIFRTSNTRGPPKSQISPASKRIRRESAPSRSPDRDVQNDDVDARMDDDHVLQDIMNYDIEEDGSMIVISTPEPIWKNDSSLSSNKSRLQTKKRQQKLTNMGVSRSQNVTGMIDGGHQVDMRSVSQPPPRESHSTPSTAPVSAAPRTTLVMRLRVKIQDRIILIPVLSSISDPTVGWLAEEASERFYQLCNMKPILSLKTKDGALLSPHDQILFLLTNDEEVHAEVDSWDMTPLPQRYVDACKSAKTVVYSNIKSILHTGAESNNLSLNNLSLGPKQLLPISKALHGQSALKELHFRGNKFGDEGVQLLCKVFPSLPNLAVLDLSASCLTGVGIQHLATAAQNSAPHAALPLQFLETLDLSYNHLSDSCTANLATLLSRLPALLTLRLAGCNISIKFFQHHRIALAEAMQAHGLQRIDVSHNQLTSVGVELLLMCAKINTLHSLKLNGVINMFPSNHIDKHLETFLLRPESVIQELSLDSCYLTHEQIPQLARFMQHCPSLEMLSVGCNPKLSCQDISELLEASAKSDTTRLQRFHATGCGIQGSLVALIDAVSEQLSHPHPLSELVFSTCAPLNKIDSESLCGIWRDQWGEQSVCACSDYSVRLAVSK